MKKIIDNIVDTWYQTSDISLRASCRSHVWNTIPWRGIVTTHKFKGIKSNITWEPLHRLCC